MKNAQMLIAIAALAGAAVAPAAAQQAQADQRIQETLERARQAGLPVELLQSKVVEGRAKGVPMDRILMVVQQRAEALGRAQTVLVGVLGSESVQSQDVAVAADALQAGVEEAALARVATTSQGQQRTVALSVLAQLVANGIVSEEALRQVQGAMARGNQALMNLPAQAVGPPPGAGPPAGVPASGRPPGAGRPPHAGPPPNAGPPPGNGGGTASGA